MKALTLNVKKRDVFGKKVKTLRKGGMLPATIYGKGVKSMSVSCDTKVFKSVYEEAGETGLVELVIDSSKGNKRPVLIHNIAKDPVTNSFLHVEFRQVDLKQKVQASVPLVHVNEAPAVTQRLGVLLTLVTTINVEALPTDLPENITVDLTSLKEEGDEIMVSSLSIPKGVTILEEKEVSIVRVAPLVTKEAEKQAEEDEAAKEEAKEEAAEGEEKEAVEGEEKETAEGEEKESEDKKETSKEQEEDKDKNTDKGKDALKDTDKGKEK